MSELENLREKFDAADDELVAALKTRFALAREMRALKIRENLPPVDPVREQAILTRLMAQVEPGDRDTLAGVYERIFGGSRGVIETIARGVCVADGRVLLCQPKGGAYSYLPGGHIEFGETGAEALVREVREELGVASTAGEFLGVDENRFVQNGRRHAEISLVYRLTLAAPLAVPAAQEDWIRFAWWPVEKLGEARILPAQMARYVS